MSDGDAVQPGGFLPASSPTPPAAGAAASAHLDTRTAASEVAEQLRASLAGGCDLLIVFASYHHAAALVDAVETIRSTFDPSCCVALTTEAAVVSGRDLEGGAGLSAIGMRLPGVSITPWSGTPDDPFPISRPLEMPDRLGLTGDARAMFLFGEPFSTPITRLMPAMQNAAEAVAEAAAETDALIPENARIDPPPPGGERRPGGAVPVLGGMASGASQPGHNVLILNDDVLSSGAVGFTLSGAVEVHARVSQGCRPVGEPLVITKVKEQRILELAGRPALDMTQALPASLSEHDRGLLRKGLLIGHVIDERARPFGRGDFLVRAIVGADEKRKALIVADRVRAGQTVQFHVRDGRTASEDLDLLLDAESLDDPPLAALLFTCNGRGQRLFGEAHHDVKLIERRLGPVPLAGFHAAGEIGPIGSRSFLHGHTAVLALIRAVQSSESD